MISQQELADKAGITRSSAAVHISNLMKKGHIAGKGYIVRTAPYAVVVGGANMDIGGRSYAPLVPRDSNPGQVRMSLGGVGRNIAHNLCLLGTEVKFLTAFGDDLSAQKLAASCGELGMDISHALQIPGAATSTYLFISGPEGDMALAVSDMDIYRHVNAGVPRRPGKPPPQRPAHRPGHQYPGGVHPVAGGECPGPPLRRPGVHRQGGETPGGAGQAPHPQAQPHRGGAPQRRGHHR